MRSPSSRGPAPRREAEVRRTQHKGTATSMTAAELAALPFQVDLEPTPPAIPEPMDAEDPSREWPEIIRGIYEAMQVDPARKWMTSADWALLVFMLETMARELQPQVVGMTDRGRVVRDLVPPKAGSVANLLKLLGQIGVTEDARMRLHKEITLFPPAEHAADGSDVADIDEMRRRLAT